MKNMLFVPKKEARKIKKQLIEEGIEDLKKQCRKHLEELDLSQPNN